MAMNDDCMKFALKQFEAAKDQPFEREIEVEFDTYDFGDRFEFDTGTEDFGF